MIKAIVFDFFGVVCPDLLWSWLGKTYKDLESQRDFFQNLTNQLDRGRMDEATFVQKIAEKTGFASETILPQIHKEFGLDEELLELIAQLKNKYKIGLMSNARAGILRKMLEEHNLYKYFDEVVISSEIGFIKPEKEFFEEALKKLNLHKEEIIFVDDRERNILAAESLGIKSFVYTSVEKLKLDLDKEGITYI